MKEKNINAVIMAGGKGTRLLPLTENTPKPLLPVGNEPVIAGIIRSIRRAGIEDIAVTLGYLADKLKAALRDEGPHIFFSHEYKPLGSAGGVKKAWRDIFSGTGALLVMSGDAVFDGEIDCFIRDFSESGSYASLICRREEDASRFGRIKTDGGKVTAFCEKDGTASPGWINCGIYCFSEDALNDIPDSVFYDFGRDFFPRAVQNGKIVRAFPDESFWCDMGTHESYLSCNMTRSGGKSVFGKGTVCPANSRVTGSVLLDNVKIGPDAEICGALIGSGAIIGARAKISRGCVIPDHAIIPDGAVVGRKEAPPTDVLAAEKP